MHATTPVFLLGTAGLRKLDDSLLPPLLACVRAALAASPFRFERSQWARAITGEDEAVYGWLALNVFTGKLGEAAALAHAAAKWDAQDERAELLSIRNDHHGDENTPESRSAQQQQPAAATIDSHELLTAGTLDLGGSSLEVAFVPSDPKLATVNVSVVDVRFQLYTHSHRHAGLNDAFDTSVRLLIPAAAAAAALTGEAQQLPHEEAEEAEGADDAAAAAGLGQVEGAEGEEEAEAAALRVPHPCLQEGYDRLYRGFAAHAVNASAVRLLGGT